MNQNSTSNYHMEMAPGTMPLALAENWTKILKFLGANALSSLMHRP